MITNSKKVVYNIIELTREEVMLILLGETVEDQATRREDGEPRLFRVYCSSPTTLDELHMQLQLRKENYEKKEQEKSCCSFKG